MKAPIQRHRYQTLPGRLLGIVAAGFAVLALCAWAFCMLWPRPLLLQLLYGKTGNGVPAITHRSMTPPGKLTDIAINDKSLFLLYATPGVVMAYSHEGAYQYTILFPYESNGSASLFADGDDLYYCNRWEKVFHLQSGVYQQVWAHDAGGEKLAELRAAAPEHQDTICWHGDDRYEISGQNVDRTDSQGAATRIVDGPELLGHFEFRSVWMCLLLSMLFAMTAFICSVRLDRYLIRKRTK